MTEAKNLGAPYELVRWIAKAGHLPVPNFSAGGIATPADAALMMQLGAEAVFVGSGIFKSEDPVGARPGDRPGHDALQGPRRARQGLVGSRRRDARHRDVEAQGVGPAADPRLVGADGPDERPLPARRPSRAGGRRGRRSPARNRLPAVALPSTAGGTVRLDRGDGRSRRAVLLPAHGRGGQVGGAAMGRHCRRAGLHAPELRLSRSPSRVRGPGGARARRRARRRRTISGRPSSASTCRSRS